MRSPITPLIAATMPEPHGRNTFTALELALP